VQIHAMTEDETGVFVDTLHRSFGQFPDDDPGSRVWRSALDPRRCLLARDDAGRVIGTAGAHTFELTLPGRTTMPVAGVTGVGVLPTHRRQGVLTALVRHQFADLRSSGVAMAVLLASEATIYGRFGYGPATFTSELRISRPRSGPAYERAHRNGESGPTAAIEVLRREDCSETLEEVYDQYRRRQPGAVSRPHPWWSLQVGPPPVSAQPRYIALHRDPHGTPDGYASYLVDTAAVLTVDEIVTVEDDVFAELAGFLIDHDLVDHVVVRNMPPDHPFRWQLADLRTAAEGSHCDGLWVRILDVPAALGSRGWFVDGQIVLDIDDPFLGERGRYLLTAADGTVECRRTEREPDLSMDVRDLGSVLLGGIAPSVLIRSGRIKVREGFGVVRADCFFLTDRPPHCVHAF